MKFSKVLFKCLVFFVLCFFITACGNDEDSPEVNASIFIEDVSSYEGNSGTTNFSFNIRTVEAVTAPVTVEFTTQDDVAIAGEDYVSKSGTATIPTGTREASVVIEVIADTLIEGDEDFKLVIANPDIGTITGSTAIGTIRNDDIFTPSNDDGYITPTTYPGYTLIWSDEFDGTELNTDDWNYETGNSGWGNNELQNYQSGTNNAYLENGKLVIEAKKENVGGSLYTSARLTTQGKQSFKYGRIDIRAKLPQGQGIWPALWSLGENFSTAGWPFCGEIDIMELVGHEPDQVHGTVHYDDAGTYIYNGGASTLSSGIFADEFHVFTIVWDASVINWYMDDNFFHGQSISSAELSEFRNPFFFIFNVAVGGNWPGSPNSSTVFPQTMEVDYIRVFQ